MAKTKKAPRSQAGREAKKRNEFPALILVAGLWGKAIMDRDRVQVVPVTFQAAAISMVGKPCLLCGKPSRFAGIMEFPVPALPVGPATAIIGVCPHCSPSAMKEGRVDPLEASPDFARQIRDAIVTLLAPAASGVPQ